MPGLHFKIAELIREAKDLGRIAAPVLDRNTAWRLDQFAAHIEGIRSATNGQIRPFQLEGLWTKPTLAYDRSPGRSVRACIDGIWEMSRVEAESRRRRRRRDSTNGSVRLVAFSGKASLRIAIYEDDTEGEWTPPPVGCDDSDEAENNEYNRLAMWRIELGRVGAPGPYFHMHALGDRDSAPFPKWLPIPRLPSVFVTPMGALEFCLGELFQDEWKRRVEETTAPVSSWCSLQERRLSYLLHWLRCCALRGGDGSPWMNLKKAVPPEDLFVRERATCEMCGSDWTMRSDGPS